MQAAMRLKARVLPGKRIELTAPELPKSGEVELIVVLPETAPPAAEAPKVFTSAVEYLDSLPPLHRSPEEWARIESEFVEERDAWER